jgi:hypothetical protein
MSTFHQKQKIHIPTAEIRMKSHTFPDYKQHEQPTNCLLHLGLSEADTLKQKNINSSLIKDPSPKTSFSYSYLAI